MPKHFLFLPFLVVSLRAAAATEKFAVDWLGGIQYREVKDSALNPGNQLFRLDSTQVDSQLRLDYKLSFENQSQLILRPLWLLRGHQTKDLSLGSEKRSIDGHVDLSEGYLNLYMCEFCSLAVGLQNFQWGPAELLSPSNPLFHFSNQQKTIQFQEKGKVISRLNLSLGNNYSLILLQNFYDNNERYWIAERSFEKLSLVKFEISSLGGANQYLGIVLGEQEAQKQFLGIYGNKGLFDSYSVYFDFKLGSGSISFYPVEVAPQVYSMQTKSTELTKTNFSGILGLRYEADWDYRFEYVYFSAGYDSQEVKNALGSVANTNPLALQNLIRLARPGLELLGQQYAYFSLRVPELGVKKENTFFARFLFSIQDSSSTTQLSFEKPLSDHWVMNTELSVSGGGAQSELALLESYSAYLGTKYSF